MLADDNEHGIVAQHDVFTGKDDKAESGSRTIEALNGV